MYKDDLLEQFKKFGLLYYYLGEKLWDLFNDYDIHKAQRIPMILESCTEDDRYTILEIMASFLWSAYDQGGLSGDITKSICKFEDSLNVDIFCRADPNIIDTLKNEYESFFQNRKNYFRVRSKHNEGTAMHGLVTVFWEKHLAIDYLVEVCAFVALVGHKKLGYLYAARMNNISNLVNYSIPEEGMSFQEARARERLWYQLKLYENGIELPNRFLIPFLLANTPDAAEAVKNEQQLTLEQVESLTNTAETILPVFSKAKTAAHNDFRDGCCTALPTFWVADYFFKGTVEYQPRAYDLRLFSWLYHESTLSSGQVCFTGDQELVSDDEIAL